MLQTAGVPWISVVGYAEMTPSDFFQDLHLERFFSSISAHCNIELSFDIFWRFAFFWIIARSYARLLSNPTDCYFVAVCVAWSHFFYGRRGAIVITRHQASNLVLLTENQQAQLVRQMLRTLIT